MHAGLIMQLLTLVIIGTLISAAIWTVSKKAAKKLSSMHYEHKKKKEYHIQVQSRKDEYKRRQEAIKQTIARLWKDEQFSSMMAKYRSLGAGASYEQNVLRKIRKVLSAKLKLKIRSLLDINEQLYITEIMTRLKL
jgi:uncharacterized membrane protein YhiD involved in acid resistance|tara:strand:- start:651 stop:1058 length:408 start_codon:yes stop_codon:yes gene_type:complete